MMKSFNVLIVDDHLLIIDAYEKALNYLSSDLKKIKFNVSIATNCDEALTKIREAPKRNPFDLIFLDIRLPPSKNGEILSGEDLGLKVRQSFKNVKIIVSTIHNTNYRLNSIFTNLNPEGFLVKSEVSYTDLISAIKSVLNGIPYYTKTVLELLRNNLSNDFTLDNIDRQLLYELSKGTKMKDLPNVILLSIGGIERRKRLLKQTFNTTRQSDRVLIEAAKEYGFL